MPTAQEIRNELARVTRERDELSARVLRTAADELTDEILERHQYLIDMVSELSMELAVVEAQERRFQSQTVSQEQPQTTITQAIAGTTMNDFLNHLRERLTSEQQLRNAIVESDGDEEEQEYDSDDEEYTDDTSNENESTYDRMRRMAREEANLLPSTITFENQHSVGTMDERVKINLFAYLTKLQDSTLYHKEISKCFVCDKEIRTLIEPFRRNYFRICSRNGKLYEKAIMVCSDCNTHRAGYCTVCQSITKLKQLKSMGNMKLCPRCIRPDNIKNLILDTAHNHRNSEEKIVSVSKLKAKDTGNIFGVEIEAIVKDNKISEVSPDNAHEIFCKTLDALKPFSVTGDGSISGNGEEYISVPMDFRNGYRILKQFQTDFANRFLTVNKSCGLHVHLYFDRSNYKPTTIRKILKGYNKLENMFFETQPASRKNNTYTQRLSSVGYYKKMLATSNCKTAEQLYKATYNKEGSRIAPINKIKMEKYDANRYYWLNLHSIFCHNTIEIRLHSGTTNANKIYLWAKAHSQLLKYLIKASEEDVDSLTVSRYLNEVASPDVKQYITARLRKFEADHKMWIAQLQEEIDITRATLTNTSALRRSSALREAVARANSMVNDTDWESNNIDDIEPTVEGDN